MVQTTRLAKSLTRLFLPVILLIVGTIAGGSVWLVYSAARPLQTTYLVTPEKYGQLSTRAAQVTEETWANKDGSQTRGWLLRGAGGAPAGVLPSQNWADPSDQPNLGGKVN